MWEKTEEAKQQKTDKRDIPRIPRDTRIPKDKDNRGEKENDRN